ncbi:unnamed protein product [Pleuronectes platessa]|uniref:Uncharacterized protein n=1 Tax=Pleuronectes platessa TaxID=8262 RepID=A0A9N7ZE46_PLEPL|nr:unnamed protein product [Pleuronectes platessa]
MSSHGTVLPDAQQQKPQTSKIASLDFAKSTKRTHPSLTSGDRGASCAPSGSAGGAHAHCPDSVVLWSGRAHQGLGQECSRSFLGEIAHRSRGSAPCPDHSLRDTRSELLHVKQPLSD